MSTEKKRKPKYHYYILLDGKHVGDSWAVSEAKAINNFWWRYVKESDEFHARDYDPADFDAVRV